MIGFGLLKYFPWTRAYHAERLRREVEEIVERSDALARAMKARAQERLRADLERALQAEREQHGLAERLRKQTIVDMQAERRARSHLAPASKPRKADEPRKVDEPVRSTSATDTTWPSMPTYVSADSSPSLSASSASCHDSGSSSSSDGGGSSDGGSCGGGE
jgi:hypothetical protein